MSKMNHLVGCIWLRRQSRQWRRLVEKWKRVADWRLTNIRPSCVFVFLCIRGLNSFFLGYLSKILFVRVNWFSEEEKNNQKEHIRDIIRFTIKACICPIEAHNPRNSWFCYYTAESACLQCLSWAFEWRNNPFQPFLASNWYFWQMTNMSDKSLLPKSEKLDKLRLSEFVQAPALYMSLNSYT